MNGNTNPMNPKNKNLLIGAGIAVVALFGAYAYGQKNPGRNILDIPP